MKIPILVDLYNETNRLFIAGAKFATSDPRLTRLIPGLEKMGERAPAIQRLAEMVKHLTTTPEPESALAELGVYLSAILNTQGDTSGADMQLVAGKPILSDLPQAISPYSALVPIITALTKSGAARVETLIDAFESGQTNDFRLYPYYSKGLEDKHAPVADLLTDTVIPALGTVMIPYLLRDLDINGGKADARRLMLLDKLGYDKVLPLADSVINDGSADAKLAAIPILGNNDDNEELLLSLADDRSASIKEAALIGLMGMDSVPGKEKMMKILSSGRFKPAVKAAARCVDAEYTKKIFELIAAKKPDKQLAEILPALANKTDDYVLDFFVALFTQLPHKTPESKEINNAIIQILTVMDNLPAALSVYERISGSKAFIQPNIYGYNGGYYATSYFKRALPVYTLAQIYDTFAPFYKAAMLYPKQLAQATELDTRWLKAFIGKQDVDSLALLINTSVQKEVLAYLKKIVSKGRDQGECFAKAVTQLTIHQPPEALGDVAKAVYKALQQTTTKTPEHRTCINGLEYGVFFKENLLHKLFYESGNSAYLEKLRDFYIDNESKLDSYYRRIFRHI